jgi:hypothetical protein
VFRSFRHCQNAIFEIQIKDEIFMIPVLHIICYAYVNVRQVFPFLHHIYLRKERKTSLIIISLIKNTEITKV